MFQARRLFGPVLLCATLSFGLSGCSSSPSSSSTAPVTPAALAVVATPVSFSIQGGAQASVAVTLSRTGTSDAVTLALSGLPAGLTAAFTQPGTGSSGTVVFSAAGNTAAGAYPLTLSATTSSLSASAALTATVTAAPTLTLSPSASSLILTQDGTATTSAFSVTHAFGNSGLITVAATGLPTGVAVQFAQPGTGTGGTPHPNHHLRARRHLPCRAHRERRHQLFFRQRFPRRRAGHPHLQHHRYHPRRQRCIRASHEHRFSAQPLRRRFLPELSLRRARAGHRAPVAAHPHSACRYIAAHACELFAPACLRLVLHRARQDRSAPACRRGRQPQFQIAQAPVFLNNSSGQFIVNSANLAVFASYAANLVRYYNTGGFTWGGQHFQSASSTHITQWAIFNEPNLNGISASQYVQIYNALVPAMLAVDPTLKFSALELSGGYYGQATAYMPTLVQPAASGGLAAQVNVLTTHFYSSCNQTDTDTAVFATVAQFTSDITYMRNELKLRADLASLPIWVTENNVNADFQQPTGYSTCHPSQIFVADARGTSAFFAAWRPYVFSQIGKAGSQALYHFLFEGSNQYGEVSSTTDAPALSYWVDYWLERTFPVVATNTPSSILTTTNTEAKPDIEVLATRNADRSVSLLITDFAIASATDNNAAGLPRTVSVNIADLGAFTSATMVQLTGRNPDCIGPHADDLQPGFVADRHSAWLWLRTHPADSLGSTGEFNSCVNL